MALSAFTLYNHHHYSSPELFHHLKQKLPIEPKPPVSPLSSAPTTPTLLSVPMNLTVLGTSHRKNGIVFVLLCLAYFS